MAYLTGVVSTIARQPTHVVTADPHLSLSATEDSLKHITQSRHGVRDRVESPPCNVLIRADEEASVITDLACGGPVTIHVAEIESGSYGSDCDLKPDFAFQPLGGIPPAVTTDPAD